MKTYKDLHLARNMTGLNVLADRNELTKKVKNSDALLRTARNLYRSSQEDPLDEELTYIYLSRFLQVFDHLIKVAKDASFINSMLGMESRQVKNQIPEIKKNLLSRYKEIEAKQQETAKSPSSASSIDERIGEPELIFNNALFITCHELFRALKEHGNSVLIMDARLEGDFSQSKIQTKFCINIPSDCIKSGLSAHVLGHTLPDSSKALWNKRDTFDAIVLMDWETVPTNYTASKIDKLRTTLVEWELGTEYKEKPVVLKGGYLEWLETYPMLCTNPHVTYSKTNAELDELLDIDNIQYPTSTGLGTNEVFHHELPQDVHPEADGLQPSVEEILKEEQEVILKNRKLLKELVNHEKEWQTIHSKISSEKNEVTLNYLKEQERKYENIIEELSEQEANLQKNQVELEDRFNLTASFKPGEFQPAGTILKDINEVQDECVLFDKKRQMLAAERQRLLDQARQAKKPVTDTNAAPQTRNLRPRKPVFDRSTKPDSFSQQHLGAIHISGTRTPVTNGLTGLKNINNTCYMNSLIQCLRHVPMIMDFYCNGVYLNHVHRKPPKLTSEMALLVRALWSNSYSVIEPREFYDKFTSHSPNFRQGRHEDCMEFFLLVLNHLSEDCAVEVKSGSWTDRERAWYKQLGDKSSIFIRHFYHQMKVDQPCTRCNDTGFRYDIENVFYLVVPEDDSFMLESMMQQYSAVQEITGFSCKKCKGTVRAIKTICHYPKVLVISLKRYKYDSKTDNFTRNDSACLFPQENFKMGKGVYNLHAIALHHGTMNQGHYTAVCRNPMDSCWYEFNDESVKSCNVRHPMIRRQAYAFFYVLQNK